MIASKRCAWPDCRTGSDVRFGPFATGAKPASHPAMSSQTYRRIGVREKSVLAEPPSDPQIRYLVIRWLGAAGVGAAGEIANVSHRFQPSAR
jgi:hypothetical protein